MKISLDYDLLGTDPEYTDAPPEVTSPEAAFDVFDNETGLLDAYVEECWALLLTTRHTLIQPVMISRGSIDHTFMSPREIYRTALAYNAAAIVLGHNHPSGDPEPSKDDMAVTRRLSEAGDLIGVQMLDHLVLGGLRQWVSMARRGHC